MGFKTGVAPGTLNRKKRETARHRRVPHLRENNMNNYLKS